MILRLTFDGMCFISHASLPDGMTTKLTISVRKCTFFASSPSLYNYLGLLILWYLEIRVHYVASIRRFIFFMQRVRFSAQCYNKNTHAMRQWRCKDFFKCVFGGGGRRREHYKLDFVEFTFRFTRHFHFWNAPSNWQNCKFNSVWLMWELMFQAMAPSSELPHERACSLLILLLVVLIYIRH